MRFATLFVLILSLIGCGEKPDLTGDQIIQKAIEAQGSKTLDDGRVSFDFRDNHFMAARQDGKFSLTRCSDVECKDTVDVLTNTDFKRTVQGKEVLLPDSSKASYGNAVNSVHYFAVLPYGLDSPSVTKELIDTSSINGKSYYKIKVGFKKQGGGTDYKDDYMYWVNRDNFYVDYLAYNYQEAEGGTRFREAYNPRIINGVRFVDYRNFVPQEQYPPLQSLDSLFINRKLDLFSVIELKNIKVVLHPDS